MYEILHVLFYLFWKEKKGGGEREADIETRICCSTYLCSHWLFLVCALTGDRTLNLGYGDGALTNTATGF